MFYSFLNKAFPHPLEPEPEHCQAQCAMCGQSMTEGYPLDLKKATSEVSDLFRYPSEWVCPPCAQLYANSALKGNLLALTDKGIRPFIARESATPERPMWRDLIMDLLPPGAQTLAIMTDESKRRLWQKARLSTFGLKWQVYFYGQYHSAATPQARLLNVGISTVRILIQLVEECLNAGFSKPAIATGLLAKPPSDFSEAIRLEKQLQGGRETDDFLIAVFVGQASERKVGDIQKPTMPCSLHRPTLPPVSAKKVNPRGESPQIAQNQLSLF